MLLNLNCYATPASVNTSGYSVSNNSAGAQAVREANAAQQAQSEANVTAENDR